MKSAAVSEIKASLSRYLRRVKGGEEVVITERGKPIAKIVPIPVREEQEEQRLRRMETEGLVRLGSGKLPRRFWARPRPKDPEASVRRALLEERREGR